MSEEIEEVINLISSEEESNAESHNTSGDNMNRSGSSDRSCIGMNNNATFPSIDIDLTLEQEVKQSNLSRSDISVINTDDLTQSKDPETSMTSMTIVKVNGCEL